MDPKDEAQKVIFEEIIREVTALPDLRGDGLSRAQVLANLALAYRYASGGAQPGTSVIK